MFPQQEAKALSRQHSAGAATYTVTIGFFAAICRQARSVDCKRQWALRLKGTILESYGVDIPKHARELVMKLGQHRENGELVRMQFCLTGYINTLRRRDKYQNSSCRYIDIPTMPIVQEARLQVVFLTLR